MIPITESTLPDLMNLNRLMYSKYSRLTRSNVKIELEHMEGGYAAAAVPPRSRFLEGVSGAGPAVTAVPFRAKQGECKETKKMVLIIVEKKDKRRRGEIMKRQRGGIKPGKNDEQFAFVLARKTRVEAECTWK